MNPYSPAEAGALVSVIVPVFKISEVLLVRCLRSVLSQTHGELEVLVVDDGSPFPIDEWVAGVTQGDPRVSVIHQANQGVSAARNAGMEAAVGSYVCFVDADDYVRPGFLSESLCLAFRTGSDVVFGGIELLHDQGSVHWRSVGREGVRSLHLAEGSELDEVRATSLRVSPSPYEPTPVTCVTNTHATLFSRRVVGDTRFRVGVTHAEDRIFIVEALGNARQAAFCTETWYVYDCTQSASATRSMPRSAAAGLGRTVQALADIGGYVAGVEREVPAPIRRAAATGVFNYVKVIAGLLGSLLPRREAISEVRGILDADGVSQALAVVETSSPREALFLACARRRRVAALLMAGRLWTLTASRTPTGRRNG